MSDQMDPRTFFLAWERASKDTIDFKKVYVDMADDLTSGLLLSQIVFWHLPDQNGRTKLRVRHDGELWVAKASYEWWDEVRMTARQVGRALDVLEERGLIVTAVYKFNGAPTKHIRLNWETFLERFQHWISTKRQNPFHRKVEMDCDKSVESLTENTTEKTTKITLTPGARSVVSPMPADAGEERNGFEIFVDHGVASDLVNGTEIRMRQGAKETIPQIAQVPLHTVDTSESLPSPCESFIAHLWGRKRLSASARMALAEPVRVKGYGEMLSPDEYYDMYPSEFADYIRNKHNWWLENGKEKGKSSAFVEVVRHYEYGNRELGWAERIAILEDSIDDILDDALPFGLYS